MKPAPLTPFHKEVEYAMGDALLDLLERARKLCRYLHLDLVDAHLLKADKEARRHV